MESKLFIIIQARMTSTRLPKKVMLPLCNKSVLEIMIQRLSSFHKHIIIATTDDGSEQKIIEMCEQLNIRYFKGSTDNVLQRYYLAAKNFGAQDTDIIVRLTSDCPLIDENIVKNIIEFYKNNNFDYASNTIQRSFPRGMDTEVFSFKCLHTAYEKASLDFEKEHVTQYINNSHKEEFTQGQYVDKKDNSKYRLTLDEELDYQAICEIYKLFYCQLNFTYKELINLLEENPYLYEINKSIEQKKVGQ